MAVSGPGMERSLEGEAGEGAMIGQGGCIQGHAEGHLILPGGEDEHLSSSRTGRDRGRSLAGDEVDSSVHIRAVQRVSKDSTTDGSPDSVKSTGGDSNNLATARGRKALTTKVNYGEGSTMSSGEGSVQAGESLGQGGGAFVLFRRDPAKQLFTAPTQDTMV